MINVMTVTKRSVNVCFTVLSL